MKKVLAISSSARLGGNSDILCDCLLSGAAESGHSTEKINIAKLSITPCLGCWACNNNNGCVVRDDMDTVIKAVRDADVIVFATPLYFYSVSGTLKNFWDRTNGYHSAFEGKSTALIVTAADKEEDCTSLAAQCYDGWLRCMDNVTDLGVISATGVFEKGDVLKNKELTNMIKSKGSSL